MLSQRESLYYRRNKIGLHCPHKAQDQKSQGIHSTVLIKTRKDLKLPETSWSHPETTWNQLQPPWNQPYHSIFLLKITYSQVVFVLILHPKVFPGQTSSNWLKFGRRVDCYMLISILMFIFSKFLSFIIFWKSLVSKSEVLQINWNLVQAYIAIYFFKISVSHIFFFDKFGPIIWSSTKWLKVRTLLYPYYDFNVYFFKILSFI